MTTTFAFTDTRTTAGPDAADLLLVLMRDAVSACADLDPDLLHSTTDAGSTVVSLASIARAAARAVGVDAHTDLASGPGIMVVRDLVAAVQLLEIGHAGANVSDTEHLGFFVPAATGLSAALLELVG